MLLRRSLDMSAGEPVSSSRQIRGPSGSRIWRFKGHPRTEFPARSENRVCVWPPELVSLRPVLRCIECGAETDRFEPGWRTLLSFDPDQDSFDEAVSYCPECSVREFEFPTRVSPRD